MRSVVYLLAQKKQHRKTLRNQHQYFWMGFWIFFSLLFKPKRLFVATSQWIFSHWFSLSSYIRAFLGILHCFQDTRMKATAPHALTVIPWYCNSALPCPIFLVCSSKATGEYSEVPWYSLVETLMWTCYLLPFIYGINWVLEHDKINANIPSNCFKT